MDTRVVEVKNGTRLNCLGEEVIACKKDCGRDTTMTGTGLCDPCWELERAIEKVRAAGYEVTPAK